MDIHADANSSYDPKEAIRVGRLLEGIKAVHYEEPCEFDHFDEMKTVADALRVPVACGEQEVSQWRFRWMIANHGADIVPVSYTHLRAHETRHDLVCRLLLE